MSASNLGCRCGGRRVQGFRIGCGGFRNANWGTYAESAVVAATNYKKTLM
jgi:hypothetical protein